MIPGNDDSSRAIRLYARGVADAVLEGRSTVIQEIVQAGDEFVEVADENAGLTAPARDGGAPAPRPRRSGARRGHRAGRSAPRRRVRTSRQRRTRSIEMADISASMVMELRQRTGLGMMECKKALTETGGDLAKAEELLRIKSGAKASKAAGRVAAEGIVGACLAADGKTARDGRSQLRDRFRLAQRGLSSRSRRRSRSSSARRIRPTSRRCRRCRSTAARSSRRAQALVQKIGENIVDPPLRALRDAGAADAVPARRRRIGVTVEVEGGDEQTGKDIAMHVAASAAPGAMRPVCVSRDQVPAELIAKEREIYTAQAADSGKPADIVAKMVEGRINKYLAEVTLLGQPFVKNPDETVEKHLQGARARPSRRSRSTSSARASRRARTTSPPKWRRWPRPDRAAAHCPSVQRSATP